MENFNYVNAFAEIHSVCVCFVSDFVVGRAVARTL
jgi:hypothetical protein